MCASLFPASRLKQNGFSLLELVVTLAITGALVAAAGFEFAGWMSRYRVESQIKTLYSDLMALRIRALEKNVQHVAMLSGSGYNSCEDSNNNDTCDPGEPVLEGLSNSGMKYPLAWKLGLGVDKIVFDGKGLFWPNGSIRLLKPDNVNSWTPGEVDYDCIVIYITRIKPGKYNGTKCVMR